jgi:hypothetical protein
LGILYPPYQVFELQATAAEMNGESILFNGTSTTADVIIDPVYIETEDVVNGVWEDDNTAINVAGVTCCI